jgi:hypothetical protein
MMVCPAKSKSRFFHQTLMLKMAIRHLIDPSAQTWPVERAARIVHTGGANNRIITTPKTPGVLFMTWR